MLDRLEAAHFAPLVGRSHTLELADGTRLPVRVDAVTSRPQARMPQAPREPFVVTLTALAPTAFTDGLCALELPALGRVEGVWINRVAALGRDPAGAYFQIVFN